MISGHSGNRQAAISTNRAAPLGESYFFKLRPGIGPLADKPAPHFVIAALANLGFLFHGSALSHNVSPLPPAVHEYIYYII